MEQNEEPKVTVVDTISLSEAATLLGFESFHGVKKLIRAGKLNAFRKKWSRNRVVLRSDVEKLAEVEDWK